MGHTNNNFRTNEERKTPFGTNGAAITSGPGVLRILDENQFGQKKGTANTGNRYTSGGQAFGY